MIRLETPLTKEKVKNLRAGDFVLLSGTIYTGRDAAHKRFQELLDKDQKLPFQVKDATIYYVGPSPAREGKVIGSAGPTTSYRMDAYTPGMLHAGLCAMIGKGDRCKEVVEAIQEYGAVYFAAIGGVAALMGQCIISSKIIAYEDLGSEAVRELQVKDMPLTVVIDSLGNNLYKIGPLNYKSSNIIHFTSI